MIKLRSYCIFIFLAIILGCRGNPSEAPTPAKSRGSISGTMVARYFYPDYPVSNAMIHLTSAQFTDSTRADSSGHFEIPNIPPGTYTLLASASTYDTLDSTIVITGGVPLTFRLELSLIYDYVPGVILAGFTDSCTIVQVFELCTAFDLSVGYLAGFDHRSLLPTDSLDIVRQVLYSKPYLGATDNTVFVHDDTIRIVPHFYHMDSAAVMDWLYTQQQLSVVSVPTIYRDGDLHTEDGLEIVKIGDLRSHPIIRWLRLSYRYPIWPRSVMDPHDPDRKGWDMRRELQ
jgi:hypothetical protein